jgi:hypothetical protein
MSPGDGAGSPLRSLIIVDDPRQFAMVVQSKFGEELK